MRKTLVPFCLLALASSVVAPRQARAQTASDAERRELLLSVSMAHRAGDHTRALELAQRALAARETGTLHGVILRELVDLGRDVEGLAHAEACVRDAPTQRPTPDRDVILAFCREQVSALSSRVGTVDVQLAPSPPGARVVVAGSVVEAPGAAMRVAAGRVTLDVSAPGYVTIHRELDVAGGARVVLPLSLEAEPRPPVVVTMPTTVAVAPLRVTTPHAVRPVTTATRRHPVGLVVAGVGVASLLTGGIAWAAAQGLCGHDAFSFSSTCAAAPGDRSTVEALDVASTATLVVGAALVALGVTLHFTVREGEASAASSRVSVALGPGSLCLSGTF